MKRIFAKSTLRSFWEEHPNSEQYLKTWFDTAMNSTWKRPNSIKESYANASILKNGRVVFIIKGNTYRLVVRFNFEKQWAFIRFIGTHKEYDNIDANTILKNKKMNIKPIKTETDYRTALAQLDKVFNAPAGTPESDEADILGLLIDEYEKENYPIEAPDPIAAIKIRMEEMQLKQLDLVPEIGGKSRVSEILNKKRRLTVEMIRKLAVKLNLSADLLIKDYQLSQ